VGGLVGGIVAAFVICVLGTIFGIRWHRRRLAILAAAALVNINNENQNSNIISVHDDTTNNDDHHKKKKDKDSPKVNKEQSFSMQPMMGGV
jgi:hypothetical protein